MFFFRRCQVRAPVHQRFRLFFGDVELAVFPILTVLNVRVVRVVRVCDLKVRFFLELRSKSYEWYRRQVQSRGRNLGQEGWRKEILLPIQLVVLELVEKC